MEYEKIELDQEAIERMVREAKPSYEDKSYFRYNILRKCKPEVFTADGVVGALVHPVVIKTTEPAR